MEVNPYRAPATTDPAPPSAVERRALLPLGWRLPLMIVALHGPFAWIPFVTASESYRSTWLWMWPVLPGLIPGIAPGAFLFGRRLNVELPLMGLATLVFLVTLTWLSGRGRTGLIAGFVTALAISVPTSFVAYGLFRM